ncbi:MAG TPA: hypothetical protein VMY37_01260 [Thermoguttaceae bacterium]|nr:hypothetical protein [Thermoguttaceae bacterium]
MKTTARILTGLISVVLSCSVGVSFAGPLSTGNDASLGTAGASQTASYRSDEARRRCDDLLKRARQAMAENDLESAESLLAQAEAMGVKYGPFDRGDTPKNVRRDLERTRKAASPARPSQLFSPLSLGNKRAPVTDPFAARNDGSATALPDAKSRAKSYLLNGRTELTQNDLPAAAHWYRQAAEQQATFGPGEDSPTKLAGEILRRGGRLDDSAQAVGTTTRNVRPLPPIDQAAPLGPGSENGSSARSGPFLLAARRALAEGDVRRADEMVQQANALGVQYGPLDDSPAKVESVIRSYNDVMAQQAERGNSEGFRSQYARLLMEQAEGLLPYREYDRAEHLATLASRQGVSFGPYQANPEGLLKRIATVRRQDRFSPSGVVGVGGQDIVPATGNPQMDRTASHAVYDQSNDRTRNMLAGAQQPTPAVPFGAYRSGFGAPTPAPPSPSMSPQASMPGPSVGESLFQQGEAALMAHDTARANEYFRQAADYRDQLDPITAQQLQERLQMLSPGAAGPPAPSMIDQAAAAQRSLYQQVAVDVAHQEGEAKALRQTDPKGALALLDETRRKVEAAGLEPTARDRLLVRVDRSLAEMQQYIEQNRARIDLEERSQRTREDIDRERQMTFDVQEKLALCVEEYNQLMDEERFAEAEVVAKRAAELDPDNPLTLQLLTTSRLVRHHFSNLDLRAQREEGFWEQMHGVELAAIPRNDMEPYVFGDAREWEALSLRRQAWTAEHGRRRTEGELEIEQKLKTPVLLEFDSAPLSQVMDYLARMAAVNLHLDPQGLADEGITTDDPITINLSQEISLKSALNLILEPLHLSYVIKDEVLKITSEQYRDGDLYQQVYNVADLVVPIPNFVPSTGMGLAGAYHDALGSVGFGGQGPFGGIGSPLAVVASRSGARNNAMISPTVLAQMPTGQAGTSSPGSMPMGFGGPGGLGGGAMADFDSLIELITTTVAPESWDDVGGPGSIAPFETNLSLVVSQTQEVHDQLVDLLEQLRRMQDLQVTIEVRFITLNDNFFERIGIDFDFDIDDDVDRPFQVFGRVVGGDDEDRDPGTEPVRDTADTDHNNPSSVTVGLSSPGVFSADLDIPFQQNSFGLAVPQFGGFDATAGAQLGFAILSDIEAFFFVSAAQGDRRSNILQAPKVTLFNGQQAFVSDTSQSPFVISVIPVVGDFAAAQQPVIVVLSEGTFLTVQAVVSDDRRFVRLTVVPFFSRIGDVETFTFEGSQTTTVNSSQQGDQETPNDNTSSSSGGTTTRSGTTVQLPTFSFVTVTTTVSVPDGGTVLLGGIKRLSEGRNEFGVPILNKLPYVSRLFKNVGIGRETQSLMMMVTPRIIIQEEEEEQLGILNP